MIKLLSCIVSTLFISSSALAEEAGKETYASSVTSGTIAETFLALLLVIVAIFTCSWLLKRFNPRIRRNIATTRVLSSYALGRREKLMLVEIHDQRLLLGVTAANIQLIKDLTDITPTDSTIDNTPSKEEETLFNKLLKR